MESRNGDRLCRGFTGVAFDGSLHEKAAESFEFVEEIRMKVDEETESNGFTLRGSELEDGTHLGVLRDIDTRSYKEEVHYRLILLVFDGPEEGGCLLFINDVHFGTSCDQQSAGGNVA